MPRIKIRLSPLTYALMALMLIEIVLSIMSLSLPWGRTSAGTDIRFGVAGLLTWFGFIPVFLQVGYIAVESRVFQTLYIVTDFLIGAFLIFVQTLTYLRYEHFEFGFFLVFALGAVVVLAGILCVIEKRIHPKLQARGRAREIPITFG